MRKLWNLNSVSKCDSARDQDTSESDTIIMLLTEVIHIQVTYKE